MSWLLFLDESGHDHRSTPYEVRGGIAIHASKLWPFVKDLKNKELDAFGITLHQVRKELKGCKLLDKDRYKWAEQKTTMPADERRKNCRKFFTKGLEHKSPSRDEFTAYGQACLEMATGIFESLRDHQAQMFAAAIPRNIAKPGTDEAEEFLRKDQVFLFERYFHLLEKEQQHGLIVMDEVDKTDDRRFVRRLEDYFRKTKSGRYRSSWIVPTPFFVASDMTYPVQAADLVIYCINWGFRRPKGMNEPVRAEIASDFNHWLSNLQYEGDFINDLGNHKLYGVVFVPDPYTSRNDGI